MFPTYSIKYLLGPLIQNFWFRRCAERDEAPGALQLARRREVLEHVVGQPQHEPLGGGVVAGAASECPVQCERGNSAAHSRTWSAACA